jgi:signal transduction histidine kinase
VVTGIGFAVAVYVRRHRRSAILIGGIIIGVGVFSMHFVGMAALSMFALVAVYDPGYVLASLGLGVLFSVLALRTTRKDNGLASRLNAASLLATGIAALHFTAMAGISFAADPAIAIPEASMPTEWLAFGVAMTTLVVLASALAGSIVDQRFGTMAAREAARLRATVAELEETKAHLERTSSELMLALEAAAAGSQAKSQFLATMSHELRTPLNAVIGFSEALGSGIHGSLGERQREYVQHIKEAGTHLLQLVNDVLDLSKLDANRVDLDIVQIGIGEVFTSVVGLLSTNAQAAGIAVRQELREGLGHLLGDERRIRQVLINLVSNAIKFTPAGGTVTLSAWPEASGLVISVADTGIGMAAEDIPIALERFGQIDGRLARRFEGTGLGLPLSKKLVELHGGKLAIDSTLGVGTTVTLTFPADRVVSARRAA